MLSASFRRAVLVTFLSLLIALGLVGQVTAQPQSPHVLLLKVDGIINPVKERLIARTLEQAREDDAELVVIQLDTPGGLLSSTRTIVQDLLAAEVPVAVYVWPQGARAGSAGTFITAAGHFAVMAPGTNIGAATPVGSGGQDLNETLANKVTNDAAGLIRSIAEERGRNADKLEETVRSAASFSAMEAVELNVVDFMAHDVDDLLAQLNGKTVETEAGTRVLDTRDLRQKRVNKTFVEHFLEFISDPNVSFILLTVGGLGIVMEIFSPGLIVPAVVGVISLLLAFLALGNLPVNWAGVIFIVLAAVLAVLETQVEGFGILGAGAIVSFVIGGLLLFAQFGGGSPTLPPISVNRWLLVGVSATLAMPLLYLVYLKYVQSKEEQETGTAMLVGQTGRVTSDLDPRGLVHIGDINWTAISEDGTVIPAGESVRVAKVDGLILTVSRSNSPEQ